MSLPAELKWFSYDQNNTGGVFDIDDKVCPRVYIQAISESDADEKAKSLGIYFNGVEEGIDCECCGDRWYHGSEVTLPVKWSKNLSFETIEEYVDHLIRQYGHSVVDSSVPEARMYYANGFIRESFVR